MLLKLFVSIFTIGLIFMSFDYSCASPAYTHSNINKPINKIRMETMAWLGLLRYKEHTNSKEAVTGIILLNKRIAMGNAHEISKIDQISIRHTTRAMFMAPGNHTWYCKVINYTLHPEFGHDTLNTVALVKLQFDGKTYHWDLLVWPYFTARSFTDDIFAIGFTDRRDGALEQVVYRMKDVELSDCIKFYEDEQLDTKWMRPMEYHCFRSMRSTHSCVFEAGMALVTNHTGTWTLLGISALGPGCSLPSRFIDFPSYAPWIERAANITGGIRTRRDYADEWSFDEFRDADFVFLEQINNNTIILKPGSSFNDELLWGKCEGLLIYRETLNLVVSGAGEHGYGNYELSTYDLTYPDLKCIKVKLDCVKSSQLNVWSNLGFLQDDIQPYIKDVPFYERGATNRPRYYIFATDNWSNYDHLKVNTMSFRFEFVHKAKLDIIYYAQDDNNPLPTALPWRVWAPDTPNVARINRL